jgi:quinate dehydrogenase
VTLEFAPVDLNMAIQRQPITALSSEEVLRQHLDVPHVAYLVGLPIAHSSSPALHESISASTKFPYRQVLVESNDLSRFLDYIRSHAPSPKFLGSGVTMPYKVSVIPHLDHLTPEAKAIGAVNTIFLRPNPSNPNESQWWGTNTDCIGIRDAFLNNVDSSLIDSWGGKPALVVGGGGTCRAAIYALTTFLKASQVYILNRDKAEVEAVLTECRNRGAADNLQHVSSIEQAESLSPPSLIVSAVPDFPPSTDSEKMVRHLLQYFMQKKVTEESQTGALLEMCYHPSPNTQISKLASDCTWQVIGGIEAMICQGLEQSKLWTGQEMNETVIENARASVARREVEKHAS